ncbi:MAG: nuclear transport factor 2 family protein [Paraburkholderia fungorum]|nr:nuclear transport factor 2 family protein [Paraburkholderia fungorum]
MMTVCITGQIMMQPNQPSKTWQEIAGNVVVCFVEAVNAFDADKLADLFAQDAHVNDQLRDFWGADAIGNWIRDEIVGMHFSMDVLHARKHFDDLILSATVSGDFDSTGLPDPMILSFIFYVHAGKIARLIILLTKTEEAEPDIRKASR